MRVGEHVGAADFSGELDAAGGTFHRKEFARGSGCMPALLDAGPAVQMKQNAPDHSTGTHGQSGLLTRLNTTINLCVAQFEGAVMTDHAPLVFELIGIVPAVRLAVIRITRVIAVDGDARAGEFDF